MANKDNAGASDEQDRGDGIPRRKVLALIGGTIAGLPLLGQAADRIYGIPTSTQQGANAYKTDADVVRLQLARADIPTELWNDILSLNTLVEDILTDPNNAEGFSRNPRQFLENRGFQSDMFPVDCLELRMLQAATDPDTNWAKRQGDLPLFFRRLEEKKVFDTINVSKLAKTIGDVFKKDYNAYMTALQETNQAKQSTRSPLAAAQEPNAVVVNVVVAVNVVAAVNVAVAVLLAVSVGVCGLLTAPVTHTKEMQAMVNNAARATHLARLIGDRAFESRVLNHFIDRHGTLIMQSLDELAFFRNLRVPKDKFHDALVLSIRNQLGVTTA